MEYQNNKLFEKLKLGKVKTSIGKYNLRSRWYEPPIGRFLTTDNYPGNRREPQSLHKYAYCNGNPINAVDPSGNFALLMDPLTTISIQENQQATYSWATISISNKATYVIIAMLAGTLAIDLACDIDEHLERKPAAEDIKQFVVEKQKSADPLTESDFVDLAQKILPKIPTEYQSKNLYAHYSKKDPITAMSLVNRGLWGADKLPPDGSYANPFPFIYLTDWDARWYNSMEYTPGAMYIVWPKRGFEPTLGPRVVQAHNGMGGGGTEVAFGRGSGEGGTVFGPIPIPEGEFRW